MLRPLPSGCTPIGPQFSHILYLDSIHQPTKEQLMPSKHSLVYWTLAVKPQSGTTDNEGVHQEIPPARITNRLHENQVLRIYASVH